VHEDLALEQVERLVGLGMDVQRRDLPLLEVVLEHDERAAGLCAGDLPGEGPAAAEPELFALTLLPDRCAQCLHDVSQPL
jgi:hypothetical protein